MTRSIALPRGPRLVPPPAVLAAVFGVLVVAGCSATHVGESWQCPLAQGGSCESVAAADPAVPARAAGGTVAGEPLYRVHANANAERSPVMARDEEPCDAQCGPFAWLARLFAAVADSAGSSPAGDGAGGGASHGPAAGAAPSSVAVSARPPSDGGRPAPEKPALPRSVDDDAPSVRTAGGEPAPVPGDEDLREPEVIGRIWIAPFVDGGGIFREGAYVRAVLAPGGWRLK